MTYEILLRKYWATLLTHLEAAEAAELLDDPVMRHNFEQLDRTLTMLAKLHEARIRLRNTICHDIRNSHLRRRGNIQRAPEEADWPRLADGDEEWVDAAEACALDEQCNDNDNAIEPDTDVSDCGLSESDEFSVPTENARQTPFTEHHPHDTTLETLNHLTHLMKEEFTTRKTFLYTIKHLAVTAICVMQACTTTKETQPDGEYRDWLLSNISDNIAECNAKLASLPLKEDNVLCVSMRRLNRAFGELMDKLGRRGRCESGVRGGRTVEYRKMASVSWAVDTESDSDEQPSLMSENTASRDHPLPQPHPSTATSTIPNVLVTADMSWTCNQQKETIRFNKILLPAGFNLPSDIIHAGSSTLRNSAHIYNFSGRVPPKILHEFTRPKPCLEMCGVSITLIRSPRAKTELKTAIEHWRTSMGLDIKRMRNWLSSPDGDTYIVSDFSLEPAMKDCTLPRLRGGGMDLEETHTNVPENIADDFERVYDDLLQKNAETCGTLTPSPCTEAWMKLASLLQMRNSYLEHQMREMQEMNESLTEDVHWHLNALNALEEQLREAQIERAIALAEVLDLKIQSACSTKRHESLDAVSNDGDSMYTDMASSGSDTPSTRLNSGRVNDDSDTVCANTSRSSSNHIIMPPSTALHPAARPQPTGFFFYPTHSAITLPTTRSRSFHWPPGTTLYQIRNMLILRHEHTIQENPHLAQILEIMDQRAILGVQLPESMRDEMLWIGVPDVHGARAVDGGDSVESEAWASFEKTTEASNGGVSNLFNGFSWASNRASESNATVNLRGGGFDDSVDPYPNPYPSPPPPSPPLPTDREQRHEGIADIIYVHGGLAIRVLVRTPFSSSWPRRYEIQVACRNIPDKWHTVEMPCSGGNCCKRYELPLPPCEVLPAWN